MTRKEYLKKWWLDNKDRRKLYRVKYKDKRKIYLLKNKDIIKSQIKKYYIKNRDIIKNRTRVYCMNNVEKVKKYQKYYRVGYRLKNYGITHDQYNELLKKQNNSCAICYRNQSDLKVALSIDHDHKDGKIRGLLCTSCNLILGNARDSIEILDKAKSYLKKYMRQTKASI